MYLQLHKDTSEWRVLFRTPGALPFYYPIMLDLLESLVPIPQGFSPGMVLVAWLGECWRRSLIQDGRDVIALIRFYTDDWRISKKEAGTLIAEFGYHAHVDVERFVLEECQ